VLRVCSLRVAEF